MGRSVGALYKKQNLNVIQETYKVFKTLKVYEKIMH